MGVLNGAENSEGGGGDAPARYVYSRAFSPYLGSVPCVVGRDSSEI